MDVVEVEVVEEVVVGDLDGDVGGVVPACSSPVPVHSVVDAVDVLVANAEASRACGDIVGPSPAASPLFRGPGSSLVPFCTVLYQPSSLVTAALSSPGISGRVPPIALRRSAIMAPVPSFVKASANISVVLQYRGTSLPDTLSSCILAARTAKYLVRQDEPVSCIDKLALLSTSSRGRGRDVNLPLF